MVMLSVGDVCAGDLVEVRATCKSANESGTLTVRAAVLDTERFAFCHEILSECPLELTEFSNTRVAGIIDCNRDGLLYTSIPQDGGWHAIVDGQEVEPVLVGDAMLSVPMTEGSHDIAFVYRNDAFRLGWKISAICLLLFAMTLPLYYRTRRKGKFEK